MTGSLGNSLLAIIIPLYVAALPSIESTLPQVTLIGILIALYGLINALIQPLMGMLSDKLGRRKPFIMIGLLIFAGATFSYSFVADYPKLLILRAIQGVAIAAVISGSIALMADVTERRTRGRSMGVYNTLQGLGFAIGPLIAGAVKTHYGFNAAFYIGAAVGLASSLIVYFTISERAPQSGEVKVHRPPNPQNGSQEFSRDLLLLGLIFLTMALAMSMMTALQNEFNVRLHQTVVGFSIAFSAMIAARLITQIPLGRLSDLIGRKKLVVAGLLLLAPTTMALGHVGSTLQLILMRVAQGVAAAGIAVPTLALAADKVKEGRVGVQISFVTMAFGLGLAAGPLVAGWLAGFVSFESPFYVGGTLCLLGAYLAGRYVKETVIRHR